MDRLTVQRRNRKITFKTLLVLACPYGSYAIASDWDISATAPNSLTLAAASASFRLARAVTDCCLSKTHLRICPFLVYESPNRVSLCS